MNQTVKYFLLIFLFSPLFFACPTKQKIPKTKAEITQAVRENNVTAISLWLQNGGDINANMENDQSLLYIATGPKGGFEMSKLLIENGADVNQGAGQYTPLMNAASWGNIKSIELLLDNNANKTLLNEEGKSALELIGDSREHERIKSLLQ